jgi:acyl-CoA reductase-like NAD-dependent aldehyde dehydrogenase
MRHAERAGYLRAMAAEVRKRAGDINELWPRETGVLRKMSEVIVGSLPTEFEFYASLADDYPFVEPCAPTAGGEFGLLIREPVGVVGAIVPWNVPMAQITHKIAPALLAGCTVVLKGSPNAPGEPLIMAEIAEAAGLPPGVLNVLNADRAVSELLVRNPAVDKIAFTGSTVVGRRIAAVLSDRVGRFTLELGGKSAAVIMDDYDLAEAATALANAECFLSGQVCSSLTRIVVSRSRHDVFLEALADAFSQVRLGDPFAERTQMGPLVSERQRERVESYIAQGIQSGAVLATGGGRPKDLDRGFYVEPTVFGNVDNSSVIAQEEIFGPVLCVIPADHEKHAIDIANETIYGLNASVFTNDADRALAVARELRSGTVGHNAFRTDFGMAFGGFKQSGIGREGGREVMHAYLETKTVILEGRPSQFA